MNALEVVPTKKESVPIINDGPMNASTVVAMKKTTSTVESSKNSVGDLVMAPSRKERSAPSSDNSREVRMNKRASLGGWVDGLCKYLCGFV